MSNKDQAVEVFFEIHNDIPRGGPGDFESTRKAWLMLNDLPQQPAILDIGCGPGMQTLDLAQLTEGRIVAVDNHQYFLDRLKNTAEQRHLTDKVTVMHRDMFALDFEAATFDVIWAEGSIYIMGFEQALRTWKPLLKRPGYLAATEMTWLRSDPPEKLRSFWAEEYPAMQNIEANLAVIRQTGYDLVGYFTLPETAWLTSYYTPIQQKLPALWEKYRDNPIALPVLQLEEREIDFYSKYSAYYGYVFYVMQVKWIS